MCNRSMRSGLKVFIFALLSILSLGDAAFAEGPARWSVKLRIAIPARDPSLRAPARAKAEMVDPVVAKMEAAGMAVRLQEAVGDPDAQAYDVEASSSGSVDRLRRLIYKELKPEVNLLGGVTELNVTSSGARSLATRVVISANPSTGYLWTVAGESGYVESAPANFVMHTRGVGVPQHQVLHLRNPDNGNGTIKLVYRRPWEPAAARMRIDLELDSVPDRLDLSDPDVPAVPAAPPPKGAASAIPFPVVEPAALPSSWDWRTSGIVPPVRNQNPCGGCWAFGTVGIMESALWKNGTPNVDLSEQFLISCNTSDWGCDGGLTAHKYHFDKLGLNQSVIGAVLEADKPFTATNGTCSEAYNHPHKLSGWQFIVPTEFDMPTVDQIKSAIYTYGPVTAGICAGSGSSNYTGGIFSTDETDQCNGGTNHQIILVGWNDNGGNGYWILRNSWGASWGMDGYMQIRYNISRVGEGTSWVTTPPGTPTFTIKAVPPALEVQRDGSGTASVSTTATEGFNSAVTLSAAGLPSGVTASFSPATIAAPGSGTSTLTFNVSAAAAAGSYTVRVVGTGGGESKEATVTLTVTSETGSTLFSDGFEGTQWPYFQPTGATANWSIVSTGTHPDVTPHGGSAMIKFNSYTANSGDQAVAYHTNSFPVPATASAVTLKFWMYHDTGYSSDPDSVRPYVSTDGESYTSVAPAINRYDGTTGWAEVSVDLGSYKGESSVLIGFLGTSAYGNNIYLDDVSVVATGAATPELSIAASPATVAVPKGSTGSTNVTTTVSGGFNSAVTLSATGLPSGVTAGFNPSTVAAPGSGSAILTFSVAATAAAGSYPVTVTGAGGGQTRTTTVTLTITATPTVTLTAAPTTIAAAPGETKSSVITTTGLNGFNSAVTLAAIGLPSGVTAGFTPATIAAPGSGSSTATFGVAATAVPGSYPVKIAATGGGVTQETVITLVVGAENALFSDSFEGEGWSMAPVSGTEAMWSLAGSGSHPGTTPHGGNLLALFNSYDAFSGSARLYRTAGFSIPGSAGKVTLSFWMHHDTEYTAEDRVQAQVSTDGASWNNVGLPVMRYDWSTGWSRASVDLSAYKGESDVRIGFLGTSDYGNDIYLDDVSVEAGAAGDFAIAASPASLTVARGGRGTATVTTTTSGGFSDAIDLAITGLPTGVVAAFTPATIAAPGSGTATVALRVASTAAAGSYPVTITGTGAGLTRTTPLTLTVTDSSGSFTMAASPVAVTLAQGGQASITLTTAVSGGFNSAVTLSATGLPSGMTAAFSPATIPAPGGGAATVTLSASASQAAGSYPLTLVGTGGGVTQQATVTVTVPAPHPPYFSVPGLGTYLSFGSMYSAAAGSGTIVAYACSRTLVENLTFDRDILLKIRGGYNSTFTSVTGTSVIDGRILVRRGKLVAERVAVK